MVSPLAKNDFGNFNKIEINIRPDKNLQIIGESSYKSNIENLSDNDNENSNTKECQTYITSEYFKCQICVLEYDLEYRIPMTISCGHAFCEQCLMKTLDKKECPYCKKYINSYSKNFSLIQNFNLDDNEKIREFKKNPECPNKHPMISFYSDFKDVFKCCFNSDSCSNQQQQQNNNQNIINVNNQNNNQNNSSRHLQNSQLYNPFLINYNNNSVNNNLSNNNNNNNNILNNHISGNFPLNNTFFSNINQGIQGNNNQVNIQVNSSQTPCSNYFIGCYKCSFAVCLNHTSKLSKFNLNLERKNLQCILGHKMKSVARQNDNRLKRCFNCLRIVLRLSVSCTYSSCEFTKCFDCVGININSLKECLCENKFSFGHLIKTDSRTGFNKKEMMTCSKCSEENYSMSFCENCSFYFCVKCMDPFWDEREYIKEIN